MTIVNLNRTVSPGTKHGELYPMSMISGAADEEYSDSPDYVIVYDKTALNTSHLDIYFEKLTVSKGLKVVIVKSKTFPKDGKVFAAIYAPREVLMERAEDLKILCPLQVIKHSVNIGRVRDWKEKLKHYFSPDLQSGFFKIAYDRKYDRQFKNCETGDPLKSTRIRGMLVHDIIKDVDISDELRSASDDPEDVDKRDYIYRGLAWLRETGCVKDTFFPHSNADRTLTRKLISKCGALSITSLRNYLGEKVGFCFAWRSAWLSNALGLPMLFGLLVIIFGLTTTRTKSTTKTTTERTNFSIHMAHEVYVEAIDNPVAPYYALFMCIWSILFTKIWTRFRYIYSFKWGTLNFFLSDERQVLKFTYMLRRSTLKKVFIRSLTAIFGLVLVILSIIYNLAMIYIQQMLTSLLQKYIDHQIAEISANVVVSLVNTILVTFLINPLAASASFKLTERERYYFQSDFEESLSWRVFFNCFFNNNIRIIMMLILPRFTLYNIFTRTESDVIFCKAGTCVEAISYQVAFFLLVRPFSNMSRYIFYTIKSVLRRIRCTCKSDRDSVLEMNDGRMLVLRLEKQYKLFQGARFGEGFTVMEDMNNRVAQYGFVVMYAAAFPLAPIIAFIVELILRRADIDRYLRTQRRVIPRRDEGVGSWIEITDFVNMAAIFTNVWIIAFRSYYGRDLIINWDDQLKDREQSMLALILTTMLLLLTSCIRAICQYYKIPETVKIFYREENEAAERFLKNGQIQGDGTRTI